MTDDAVKTVCCSSCHEWYDARAAACYLCGTERPEYNAHLANTIHTERVNSALSKQAGYAGAEKRVGGMIPANAAGKTGPSDLYRLPYSNDLAAGIKRKLLEGGAFG